MQRLWKDYKDSRRVMLIRNNKFGPTGPQAGDQGTIVSHFLVTAHKFPWYGVEFDDYDGVFSFAEESLQVLEP